MQIRRLLVQQSRNSKSYHLMPWEIAVRDSRYSITYHNTYIGYSFSTGIAAMTSKHSRGGADLGWGNQLNQYYTPHCADSPSRHNLRINIHTQPLPLHHNRREVAFSALKHRNTEQNVRSILHLYEWMQPKLIKQRNSRCQPDENYHSSGKKSLSKQ